MTSEVIHGDCLEVMAGMEADSFDAVVTDPPYHLGFMGKKWDGGDVAFQPATWAEVLRVAKPGAHLLAFGGTRLFHRMMVAIEDAGWEIRDTIMWVYGSGFPKSHNGEWGGTALKPAWEPIVVARKPLIGTVAANFAQHGVGGLNIDATRIPMGDEYDSTKIQRQSRHESTSYDQAKGLVGKEIATYKPGGRWPANLIHDGSDELVELFPADVKGKTGMTQHGSGTNTRYGKFARSEQSFVKDGVSDSGSAARYFYCAKANKNDRTEGGTVPNSHPTVKPTSLMRYLCRLVTPPNGTVLDPFCGSGSTGKAGALEGFNFTGIEQDEAYCEIARARIASATEGVPV